MDLANCFEMIIVNNFKGTFIFRAASSPFPFIILILYAYNISNLDRAFSQVNVLRTATVHVPGKMCWTSLPTNSNYTTVIGIIIHLPSLFKTGMGVAERWGKKDSTWILNPKLHFLV